MAVVGGGVESRTRLSSIESQPKKFVVVVIVVVIVFVVDPRNLLLKLG